MFSLFFCLRERIVTVLFDKDGRIAEEQIIASDIRVGGGLFRQTHNVADALLVCAENHPHCRLTDCRLRIGVIRSRRCPSDNRAAVRIFQSNFRHTVVIGVVRIAVQTSRQHIKTELRIVQGIGISYRKDRRSRPHSRRTVSEISRNHRIIV